MNTTAMTFDAIHRGWFAETGAHSAQQQNTATGLAGDLGILRAFFVFDLSALTASVQGATLRLELEAYLSRGDSETFAVSSVKVPARAISMSYRPGTASGRTIFEHLGSGAVYGHATVVASDVGRLIEIALAPEAVADMRAAGGDLFAVGVWLTHVDRDAKDTLRIIRFSSASEARTHQLVLETQTTVEATPTHSSVFGLLYDVPGAEVSGALREVVAKQAGTLEIMLQSLLRATVHVYENETLEDNEKTLYLKELIQQTADQLGGFAANHIHVERRIGDVLAGHTSVTLSPHCLSLLHDLEEVNIVLHTNVAVARRYLKMMRTEFKLADEDDGDEADPDIFDV
jgi:hypothetical protein